MIVDSKDLKATKPLVLFVIDTLATGGAETSLLEIASGLQAYSPLICVLYNSKADLKQSFENRGLSCRKSSAGNSLSGPILPVSRPFASGE